MEFENRVAVVTGSARGIGKAIARRLYEAGASVVIADLDPSHVDATCREISGEAADSSERIAGFACDVSKPDSVDVLFRSTRERFGRLDILVNNAGIARMARLVNTTLDDWDLTLAVNQTGVFLGMRAGARAMVEAGNGGAIVNISSVAGLEGLFGSMAYGASKWAVRGMTKIAAKELGRHGIRVNSIHPGFIDTDMLAQGNFDEEELARMARSAPVGRIGRPEDIANMALYLVSDGASFVTGQEFVVDGGWHG
jgi:3alpha(or 20beta)-hydroxysteroid dehydrogenase